MYAEDVVMSVLPYDARVVQKLDVCASVMGLDDSSYNRHIQLQVVIRRGLWIVPGYRSYWSPSSRSGFLQQ